MMLKRFSTTLRAGALAALFVVSTSAAALAAPIVNFSTTGEFGATGTNSVTFTGGGSATVVFSGVALNSHDLQFGISNTNYGDFLLSTVGDFTGTASTPFTLNIMQSSPTSGNSSLLAQLTGSFVSVSGVTGETDFQVQFSSTETTIDGVTYHIQPFYFLVPPPSGAGGGAAPGVTTIQGFITAQPTVIPEPTTMMLLGTGLLAVFRARRRAGMKNDLR